MIWKDKINKWQNGVIQTYPKNIHKKFLYETSVCDKKLENEYKELFIENNELEQNYKPF
jgi:hypothetical protein